MAQKLFLLDGMALVYRAHFALVARPIFTSKGENTSALYGFTQTLLDIIKTQQPTHIGVAFDTDAPTQRHKDFAEYKATRDAMPEDISKALPHVRRMLEALRIPAIICDGYEADDLIGTIACQAEKRGFQSYLVTPDKDFGQLVSAQTFIYKPGRMGDPPETLGLPEIRARWGIQNASQVVDVLALMGDASDNIPGVPGIGEKTAIKLIGQYGTVENLLAHAGELSARSKDTLEKNRDHALLSKRLATIICDAPCDIDFDSLQLREADQDQLKRILIEFEFNSIGRRLFGDEFRAGRGFEPETPASRPAQTQKPQALEQELGFSVDPAPPRPVAAQLQDLAKVPHEYKAVTSATDRAALAAQLAAVKRFGFDLQASSPDPRNASVLGLSFSLRPHSGFFVPVAAAESAGVLDQFRPVLESLEAEKIGHNLKFAIHVLKRHNVQLRGTLFDTMVAHSLVEPDMRHSLEYIAEALLGYTPATLQKLSGRGADEETSLSDLTAQAATEFAAEKADVALQLQGALEPVLKQRLQERVFYQIEAPLVPVLACMEYEGIRIDAAALTEFAIQLSKQMDHLEKSICQLAGTVFNLNSPRQLGQILFEVLKICEAPKKTRTGQYATDEQTLMALAPDHEIVGKLLEHRTASKLKSTYADALPPSIWPPTGRVHTTFNQVATSTGRLNSQNPNLQNIPIRTERGQEIRRAFIPRGEGYLLLSADYSQIELRIIAALSREAGLLDAFRTGADVHTATAARVFGVAPEAVTPEMRRKAKMVNYGIAYGISAFGLAQRLAIPRKEAADIIDQYFTKFPGIREYMDQTIESCRSRGYVETVTGRRRYLRDIRSSNNAVRSAAERNAINAPIQGTAADLIKVAMILIHDELEKRKLLTRMVLQVHDELVFDLYASEQDEVSAVVKEKMTTAIALDVPIEVELGVGRNWLEAH